MALPRSNLLLSALLLLSPLRSAVAQQIGTNQVEIHPLLPTKRCTTSGGCKQSNTSIVLDANYRWLHKVGGYDSCKGPSVPGGKAASVFNSSICTDAESCVKNCAIEGVGNYEEQGLSVKGNAVTLNLFMKGQKRSPRAYLFDEETGAYANYSLLNQEFAFDVDTSKTGCAINGALYLVEMDITGHKDTLNKAGAAYGVGYCDAQCPDTEFLGGRANFAGAGACCNEMDIWEANREAMTFTPHPCNFTGLYACKEPECGNAKGLNRDNSVCDKNGCDFNGYRHGARSFYGKGANKTLDSTKPFTVVTQFITSDGTSEGYLKSIRRLYIQGGTMIKEVTPQVKGISAVNEMSDEYCDQQKVTYGGGSKPDSFQRQGGLKQHGESLRKGMVLALSLWSGGGMYWLDAAIPATGGGPGSVRGPCSPTGGSEDEIKRGNADAAVIFSNIRSGDIGSTYKSSKA